MRTLCSWTALAAIAAAAPASGMSIHQAARTGNTGQLNSMLKRNRALANAKDSSGRTPLHHAAAISPTNRSAFAKAATCARMLLMAGAGVRATDDQDGATPLHNACKRGNILVAKLLIDARADVNARDRAKRTPIHKAAGSGNAQLVMLLLAKKADTKLLSCYDETPLHSASSGAVAQILLRKGVDPKAVSTEGQTALHNASERGKIDVMMVLLKAGAKVNAANERDETPLHLAAGRGQVEATLALLRSGADVNAVSRGGTAEQMAKKSLARKKESKMWADWKTKECERYEEIIRILAACAAKKK